MSMQVRPTGPIGSATQILASEQPLVVNLRATKEQRLRHLHAEIQDSLLLPLELIPEHTSFCESSPQSLGFFLLNILEPAIVCYENDTDALDTLLTFHNNFKNIIRDFLPPDTSIDLFLQKCEKQSNQAIKKELKRFHLQEKTQKVYEKANEINHLNLSQNQAINARILQINAYREEEVERLKNRLNPLTNKMQRVIEKAQNASPEIKSFCKRMEEQDAACQQLLQQCETVVNGVRT